MLHDHKLYGLTAHSPPGSCSSQIRSDVERDEPMMLIAALGFITAQTAKSFTVDLFGSMTATQQ